MINVSQNILSFPHKWYLCAFFLLDLVDRMSNVKTSTDKTESDSAEIAARADQINEKVDKEMMPKIEELQKIHSGDFEDIRGTSKSRPLLLGLLITGRGFDPHPGAVLCPWARQFIPIP